MILYNLHQFFIIQYDPGPWFVQISNFSFVDVDFPMYGNIFLDPKSAWKKDLTNFNDIHTWTRVGVAGLATSKILKRSCPPRKYALLYHF